VSIDKTEVRGEKEEAGGRGGNGHLLKEFLFTGGKESRGKAHESLPLK